jgi:hypothetical protein
MADKKSRVTWHVTSFTGIRDIFLKSRPALGYSYWTKPASMTSISLLNSPTLYDKLFQIRQSVPFWYRAESAKDNIDAIFLSSGAISVQFFALQCHVFSEHRISSRGAIRTTLRGWTLTMVLPYRLATTLSSIPFR